MQLEEVLQALCAEGGPSGFEADVVSAAKELLRPLVDEVWTGRLGDLLGVRRCGKPGAKKLLLDAHLDEIGLLVTGIEDGYLRFRTIGGVDPRMLPARELTILTQPPLLGVVATRPPHLQGAEERDKSIPMEELRIDIGMTQEEAEKAVPVGTPAVYRGGCFALGEDKLCGKSMDDRSCFAVLLRTMELLRDRELDVDVYVLGSTCEETDSAGAIVTAFDVAPDYCVAVDVTFGTTPDGPKEKTCALKGGPAIALGPNMTRWMSARLMGKAEEKGIPYQLEVMGGTSGTNGWRIQIVREGIATAVLSLPLRYMHTPIEVFDREDFEQTARLLAEFVTDLGKEAPEC